jgi:DNA-binding NarL/FixJ family response regulator
MTKKIETQTDEKISTIVENYIKEIAESIQDQTIENMLFANDEEITIYFSKLIFVNELKQYEKVLLALVANGYSYREIAEMMQIGHSTIFAKVQKIKNNMKKIMKNNSIETYYKKINKKIK